MRERNTLALYPDTYLPLSKFESIHWVSIDANQFTSTIKLYRSWFGPLQAPSRSRYGRATVLYGNVLTRMTYSFLQKRLAYELKTFCDKGDHKGIGSQLVCWKRIKDIYNNPLIPNQYYATHELLT